MQAGKKGLLLLIATVALACNAVVDIRLAIAETLQESEQKTREKAEVAQKFQSWKEARSPQQQAWETVLEQNLGTFYLPIYQREKIAGHETAWDYVEDVPGLPRVLLIGDSISDGYTIATRKGLKGIANVHRAPENCGPTTNGLKKLDLWLNGEHWDVIHVNFGLHETKTPIADYEHRLEEIITRLQATGAKVIWASTTPIPDDWKHSPGISQVIVDLNTSAAGVMQRHHVPIDDLYGLILPRLAETQNPQDIHFSSKGYDLMAEQVAASIRHELDQKAGRTSSQ